MNRIVEGRVGSDKHCCVPLCNGNGRLHPELSFHRFPSDANARRDWIVAIRRDPGPAFKISNETVVCARHFTKNDYNWTPLRKNLKPQSIPSQFPWSKVTVKRRELQRQPMCSSSQMVAGNTPGMPATIEEGQGLVPDRKKIAVDSCPSESLGSAGIILEQKSEIQKLQDKIKEKEKELADMQAKISIEKFGLHRFTSDRTLFMFYTGFTSIDIFYAFNDYIKPAANSMTSLYYQASCSRSPNLVGRQRNMLLIDELFMFLCRLKCGLLEQDLAVRFNIHVSSVSRKIITWVNFLYFVLGSFKIWPSKARILQKMPDDFKYTFPNTRVIIDCTEIKTEQPSALGLGSKSYSAYKSSHTWKGLVGIAPHGAVSFISNLYTGCISDIEITKLSGLLSLLEAGDEIMADKGFSIQKVLQGTGVSVVMPPFLRSGKFTAEEVKATQKIARLRIHIERHIRRVKENHFFDTIVPLSMVGSINQMWTVANLLTLFRGPLVKQWA